MNAQLVHTIAHRIALTQALTQIIVNTTDQAHSRNNL